MSFISFTQLWFNPLEYEYIDEAVTPSRGSGLGKVVGKTSARATHHIMRTTFAGLVWLFFKYMGEKLGMHFGG